MCRYLDVHLFDCFIVSFSLLDFWSRILKRIWFLTTWNVEWLCLMDKYSSIHGLFMLLQNPLLNNLFTVWYALKISPFLPFFTFKCTWKIHKLDDYKKLFSQVIFHFFSAFVSFDTHNKFHAQKPFVNVTFWDKKEAKRRRENKEKDVKSRGDFLLRFK